MTTEKDNLHVAILEPYYGGSHAAFVDTLAGHTRHRVTLVTLPARKWKWRMRGAAVWFTRDGDDWLAGADRDPYDVILANDMLAVADLRALLPVAPPFLGGAVSSPPARGVQENSPPPTRGGAAWMQRPRRDLPIVCYFHENQLTYPLPNEDDRDFQYGMTNITSCLAADAVWFNSQYHLDAFLEAARGLLAKMPDYVPGRAVDEIRRKATVMYPPMQVPLRDTDGDAGSKTAHSGAVTFLWPHRWEYDKNPGPFFDAMIRLHEAGSRFRLVVLGEQFRTAPPVFADVLSRLEPHVDHAGFVPDRSDYQRLLARCDVVVSTAVQENFGMAVAEAIFAGCQPLLPARLAYPELIPAELHGTCLYPDDSALTARLTRLTDRGRLMPPSDRARLATHLTRLCSVTDAQPRIDDALQRLVRRLTDGRS